MIKRIPIGQLGIHFKQHEVDVNGMCLVLRDHREVEAAPGAVTINNAQVSRANVADVNFPGANFPGQFHKTVQIHVVCHLTENRDNVEFQDPPPTSDHEDSPVRLIILQASKGNDSISLTHETVGDKVWLSMKSREAYTKVSEWLPQFLNLSFEDAVKIAEAKDRGALAPKIQEDYEKLLDITHPGDPTAPLAFRLLCEAWAEVNVKKNTTLSGLPINAPSKLDDWLAPFHPDGDGNPAKIASVVSKMGDAASKGKAEKVLKAADGEGDLRGEVLAFLGTIKDTATQTEGGAQ